MYEIKLDDIAFPVAPSGITSLRGAKNTEFNLVSGKTISIQSQIGAETIQISTILPQTKYSWASYEDGYKKPSYYTKKLDAIRYAKKAVKLEIVRRDHRGRKLYNTIRTVTIEEYKLIESAENGTDIELEMTLKMYEEFKCSITDSTGKITKASVRSTENKPVYLSHKVVKGDCLWEIAFRYLKDGSRYKELYEWNKELIDKGNFGTGNPTYTIYPGQVLVLKP